MKRINLIKHHRKLYLLREGWARRLADTIESAVSSLLSLSISVIKLILLTLACVFFLASLLR